MRRIEPSSSKPTSRSSSKKSASYYPVEHNTRESFIKGASHVCVGPNAGTAMVLPSHGHIVGYMVANDISAWDIDEECPLSRPQSQPYAVCSSLVETGGEAGQDVEIGGGLAHELGSVI